MKTLFLLGHVTATDLPQVILYLLCSFLVGLCVALVLGIRGSTSDRDR